MHPRGIDALVDDAVGRGPVPSRADLQMVVDPDVIDGSVIDLTWGHPDPRLLDRQAVRAAADAVLTDGAGWRAMTYGYGAGPAELREMLADHLGELGERRPGGEEVFVTAGNSAALQLLLSLHCREDDVVLVESPTYFLALSILRDAPVRLVGVPSDAAGVDPEALAALAPQAVGNRGPRYLYTIPTHHNPTGRLTGTERRRQLLEVAATHGLTVIEDDVYREVSWDDRLPPSMWTLADGEGVIRLGSFSKTLGPGLRLGFLTASADVVDGLCRSGVVDSGGGVNHFTASIIGRMLADRSYHRARDAAVDAYAARCRALAGALRQFPGIEFDEPTGGYFIWARTEHDTDRLGPLARAAGVAVSRGAGSFVGDADTHRFRMAFSLYEPADLRRAAAILGRVSANSPGE